MIGLMCNASLLKIRLTVHMSELLESLDASRTLNKTTFLERAWRSLRSDKESSSLRGREVEELQVHSKVKKNSINNILCLQTDFDYNLISIHVR